MRAVTNLVPVVDEADDEKPNDVLIMKEGRELPSASDAKSREVQEERCMIGVQCKEAGDESAAFKTSFLDFLKTRSPAQIPCGQAKSRVPSFHAANVAMNSFEHLRK